MRLLLDTHIALWAVTDDRRLGRPAREYLQTAGARAWVSSASSWEIAIEHALGRGDMPIDADEAARWFRASGFEELPVSWVHARRVRRLEPLHRDPFDRLLVAQGLEEELVLLTRDATVASYDRAIVLV